jgi:hypothetical protein
MQEKFKINDIVDYIKLRMQILTAEKREGDLMSVCEEFHEWLESDDYDVISVSSEKIS